MSIALRDRAIRLRGPGSRQLPTKLSDQVVALAFMGMVDAWETFLEETLCRYMAGAVSGLAPVPTMKPAHVMGTIEDARDELLKVTKNVRRGYLVISYSADVLRATNAVFATNNPYLFLGNAPHVGATNFDGLLADALKIRHRLAHTTRKTRTDFKAMLGRYGVPAVQGVNPATLLQSAPLPAVFTGMTPQATVFDQFFAYYRDCARRIVP